MRADHRAERRHDLDLRLRPLACTIFSSCRARSGASACAMPTLSVGVSCVVDVNAERTPASPSGSAHALERDDLALDREDRLHVQQLSRPRARAADAPPRRRNSSVSTVKIRALLAVAVDQRLDLLVRRAALEPRWIARPSIAIAADALSESTTRTLSPTLGRGVARSGRCPTARRDVQRVDALVRAELLVRCRKSPGVGCDVVGSCSDVRSRA
jgi:hypothetical protein